MMNDRYQQGIDDTRRELRRLITKTRDMTPSGRLAVVLSWLGSDLDQVRKLLRKDDDEVHSPQEGSD
jgi:hypothetical protein